MSGGVRNNASTSRQGFLPKLSGVAAEFLNGVGQWVTGGGAAGITELTGDVTAGPGSGSQAATLANTAVTPGTYGDETNVAQFIVDAQGRITSAVDVPIAFPAPGAVPPIKLSFTIDGGGSAVTSTGLQKYLSVPCDGTIVGVRLLADQVGDIVVDIWNDTWANRPPTDAESITAGNEPELTTDQFFEDLVLTGWDTAVLAGDLLGIAIDSVATVTWVVLELFIQPA